jgi:hypothetical protein
MYRAGAIGRALAADVHGSGNALVFWNSTGSLGQVAADSARFVDGVGWREVGEVEPVVSGPVMDPQVRWRGYTATFAWVEAQGSVDRVVLREFVPDDVPPNVYLWTLYDGMEVDEPVLLVVGDMGGGVGLSIGGLSVATDSSGTFEFRLALQPGANFIAIEAWDEQGNVFLEHAIVTFNDPLPGLEAALAQAEANASALAANLTGTQGALDSALLELAQAREQLANLSGEVANASAQLADAEARLAAAEADVDALEAEAGVSASALAAAQANATAARAEVAALQAAHASLATQLAAASDNATAALEAADAAQADAQDSAAQSAAASESAQAAQGAAGTATLVGFLGVLAGLAGVGVAVLAMRKKAS